MDALIHPPKDARKIAVDRALGNLVRARHRGDESLVYVPLFYPSGSGATLSITVEHNEFRVSDLSLAYQEAAMVGAEFGFSRRAKQVAEKYGLSVIAHTMTTRVSASRLAGAISDVAAASTETAGHLVGRATSGGEKEVAAFLFERLQSIFGLRSVEAAPEFRGASGHEWDITALVRSGKTRTAFKAVGNRAQSVYYAVSALQDIQRLAEPPRAVSVVHEIASMGNLYNVLAQAADVIEDSASNDTFFRAIAA